MAQERTSVNGMGKGHFHYFEVDSNGNGRTSMWVDERTGSRHFHRIRNFVVMAGGRDDHDHELRGGKLEEMVEKRRADGSLRERPGDDLSGASRSPQKNRELDAQEFEQLARKKRSKEIGRKPVRRFSEKIRSLKEKGY